MRSRIFLWVALAFLLFVIYSAARIGAADLLSGYARNEIDVWSTAATPPAPARLDRVAQALDVARRIAPDNPDPLEDLARLALLRAGRPDVDDAERNDSLEQGIALIRQALALRPASSYSWATLLLLKRERAEYDEEFNNALARAVTLGPWEPDVQRIVADVGMSAWAALPRTEQEMVRENFVRGMKRQYRAMMAIAQAHRNDCDGPRAKLNAGCAR